MTGLGEAGRSIPSEKGVKEEHGMVLIPSGEFVVGTTSQMRADLARRFQCHPTWLNDDLPRQTVRLKAFWMDRSPVTNSQFLAFCLATGRRGPSWWRKGPSFPAEYAEHPVVGVTGQDACAYAEWALKRLPTAEEWEAAVGGAGTVFPWGNTWPGPMKLMRVPRPSWVLPATQPVGSAECGMASSGVRDFAGQCLEWVDKVVSHHTVQFRLLKGASWIHEDPVNFRTASGCYAVEKWWVLPFVGFRCALDERVRPPRVGSASLESPAALEEWRAAAQAAPPTGPVTIEAGGGLARSVAIRAPRIGAGTAMLYAPEVIEWNGQPALAYNQTPDITWMESSLTRAAYTMRFPEFTLHAEFIAGEDTVEQRFTVVNGTDRTGTFRTSSCLNLLAQPLFYDCEQFRTYALDAQGNFIPMSRLSRGGDCVRWITGMEPEELGKDIRWAMLAVCSRNGDAIIASGRGGDGCDFTARTNSLFTCQHTDSTVDIPAKGRKTTRQVFYFLRGDLPTLLKRFRKDFEL